MCFSAQYSARTHECSLEGHSLPDARLASTTPPVFWQEEDEDMLSAYADIGTSAAAEGIFRQVLARYNRKCKPMQLVFFDDALDQLLRMHRTLCLPQVQTCSHIAPSQCISWTCQVTRIATRMPIRAAESNSMMGDSWLH